MTKLNARTVTDLDVQAPGYERTEIRTGIVHFGVGGFHRAHQAMYLDRLLALGAAREWGICGVGVMPADSRMRDVLTEQDCLYTLCVTEPDGAWTARVIGSIVEYLYAPDDPEAVIEKLAAADTRIVSLTITEGGYNISATTREFDATEPAVVADLAPGAVPATTFGLVTEALASRRSQSCPATTSRATGTSPVPPSPPSPGCAIQNWRNGSREKAPSRTRWSTGSRR
jgi:mannitol 2-dehydrogenase